MHLGICSVLTLAVSSRKMESPPKVYLHTFPPLPHVYSMSPFSLKVESWLRLHGIDYECVYCMECGRQLLTLSLTLTLSPSPSS